jgi:hypothetical protein
MLPNQAIASTHQSLCLEHKRLMHLGPIISTGGASDDLDQPSPLLLGGQRVALSARTPIRVL